MSLRISFTLEITNDDDTGHAHTTTHVTEEVPEGIDPREYLRNRVLKEFGISIQAAPQAPAPAADVNTGNVKTVNQ